MSLDSLSIAIVHVDGGPHATDHLVSLGKALVRRGNRVDILTRRQDESSADIDYPAPGVRLLRLDVGRPEPLDDAMLLRLVARFVVAAGRVVRNDGPYDLIHAHRVMSGLVAQRLKESHGIPYLASFDPLGMVSRAEHLRRDSIAHLRIDSRDSIAHLRIDIERKVMSHATRLIAECTQQSRDLRRLYGISGERISLVEPCVDTMASGALQPQSIFGVGIWRNS